MKERQPIQPKKPIEKPQTLPVVKTPEVMKKHIKRDGKR